MKHLITRSLTLLEALAELSPSSSKTTLRSWLKEGRVTVDGKVAKLSHFPLQEGQEIEVSQKQRLVDGKLRVIYEDAHLIVIDKPAGLLSVATAFDTEKTAHALLKEKFRPRKVYVVHRLDQETSGVMLFALSAPAYERLKIAFGKHDIERAYVGIVEGRVTPPKGTWTSYQIEDDNYVVHSASEEEGGRLAITHYEVENSNSHYSWLNLHLETGRKNQIRVHCQDDRHPIVGDKKYGAKTNPIKRLGLHARLLAFEHPITQKQMTFEVPPPAIFHQLIRGPDA